MTSAPEAQGFGAANFRSKLTITIMLVMVVLTGLGFYLAQRHVGEEARRDFQQDFQAQLHSLHELQNLRNRAVTDRCRVLVEKPRIHAALEDNAMDLLYPSAKDELRDLMAGEELGLDDTGSLLRARFYRFLDEHGTVLRPSNEADVGELDPKAETGLGLKHLPETQHIGYLPRSTKSGDIIDEIIAAPILSTETGEVISALVVGFKPFELPPTKSRSGLISGIWVSGHLHISSMATPAQQSLALKIGNAIGNSGALEGIIETNVAGVNHLLFYNRINRDSVYPPAYEICLYPLGYYEAWKRRLLWQIGLGGCLLLVGGFFTSRLIAARLAAPVADLEATSKLDHAERKRAEAALESTSEELERTARYSADASHQLKSPVTVLRAGLESLLAHPGFGSEVYEELSNLLHQTYRLTGVIDDLLLLARMDAGHVRLASEPVNIGQLIDEWLDDFNAIPDAPDLETEKKLPPKLFVAGERRYTSLILQNLLENARKYNRPGGKIRITGQNNDGAVVLKVGNTGRAIPSELQKDLFERFRRGTDHKNVSGHGLGLNVARELARLHGGDLKLVGSNDDWTEFEVVFRAASPPVA